MTITKIFGMIFFLNIAVSAIIIKNCSHDKEQEPQSESGVFSEDYLFLGEELNFSGQAEDLIFLGKKLNFRGKTTLGLISLSEKLYYTGSSGNGIIAGASEISIKGTINGNNYAGCKSFTIGDTAIVNGNLFIGSAKLLINGKLNGDLYAGAGEITINNEIKGNVTAYSGRITIGEKGKITGNLFYTSKEKLSGTEAARVAGTIKHEGKFNSDKDWKSFVKFMKSIGYIIIIFMALSIIVIGLLILLIPAFKKLEQPQSEKTFWNTALWGLIPVFMYPAVIIMCIIMIITIPFAVFLILSILPLFFIAYIIGATLFGKYLVTKFKWNVHKRHYLFLIGMFANLIISIIPFIGFFAKLLVIALGWGTIISFLFNKDLTVAENIQTTTTDN
jgi:cytoskeletal protein CcmA (bactofilin family)